MAEFDFPNKVKAALETCDRESSVFEEANPIVQNTEFEDFDFLITSERDLFHYNGYGEICGHCAELVLFQNIFDVDTTALNELKSWVEDNWFNARKDESHDGIRFRIQKSFIFFIDGFLSLKENAEKGFSGLPTEFEIVAEIEEEEFVYGYPYKYKQFLEHLLFSLETDIFCRYDASVVKKALEINAKLQTNFSDSKIPDQYLTALIDKVKFIAFKVILRSERDIVKITSHSKTLPEFSGKENFKSNGFQALYDKIDYHYFGKIDLKEKFFRSARSDRENKGKTTNCSSYHSLAKYFKDETRSNSDLKSLVDEYEKGLPDRLEAANLYDQFCLKVNHLYFLNNLLSSRLELLEKKKNVTVDELELVFNDLEHITNFQRDYDLPNYFPYFKTVIGGVRILKAITSKSIDLVQNIEDAMDKVDSAKDRMMESYKQISFSYGQAFKLPSNECLFNDLKPIFIYSAFYLPIDYKLVRERDLGVALQELDNLRNFTRVTKVLVEEKAKLLEEVRKTNQLLADTDKRSVEILSIFSAIVLFSIGSFKIFELDLMMPELAFLYIGSIGTTLFLFVFLIKWAIGHDNQRLTNYHKWFFSGILLVNLLSICSLNGWGPFSKRMYIETVRHETNDSIKVERIVISEPKETVDTIPNSEIHSNLPADSIEKDVRPSKPKPVVRQSP